MSEEIIMGAEGDRIKKVTKGGKHKTRWKDQYARKPFHRTFTKFAKRNGVKIALVGDSFCNSVKSDPYKSWPYIIAEELNASLISLGRAGSALMHSYEDLLEVVNEADYIIFCITEPNRIPNRFGLPLTTALLSDFRWIESNGEINWVSDNLKNGVALPGHIPYNWGDNWGLTSKQTLSVLASINMYYDVLWDPRIHEINHRGLLMQMDELCMQKNKPCFWFQGFHNSGLSLDYADSEEELPKEAYTFIPKSGPVGDWTLASLSMNELASYKLSAKICRQLTGDNWSDEDRRRLRKAGYPDTIRFNHFGSEYNRYFANMILDVINNAKNYMRQDRHRKEIITMAEYFPVNRKDWWQKASYWT